ncbi:hypothetical protein [Demetria terragena]|nr:hypothetical protein [Demetria terragena]
MFQNVHQQLALQREPRSLHGVRRRSLQVALQGRRREQARLER